MSYLQVVCEQHRLVEQHLDKFLQGSGDPLPSTVRSARARGARARGSGRGALGLGGPTPCHGVWHSPLYD